MLLGIKYGRSMISGGMLVIVAGYRAEEAGSRVQPTEDLFFTSSFLIVFSVFLLNILTQILCFFFSFCNCCIGLNFYLSNRLKQSNLFSLFVFAQQQCSYKWNQNQFEDSPWMLHLS